VAGTSYPLAKVDRLPLVAARHTEVELQVRLLDRDLDWVERTGDARALDGWSDRLAGLAVDTFDERQRLLLDQARARLGRALDAAR
jgi:hypothetical protein